VVIGGGPAGSTVSTLLAQQGVRVQLFERERFPRFHIGESLIPETYWVLKRLDMLPKMQQSHFVKKYSVQFVNAHGRNSAPFYFWDNKPHECSQTWQVVRSEFDQMMLNNAREHGVAVHEGVRVHDVLFEGDRAVGVKIKDQDGSFREVRAQVVVDASGQNGLIMNRLRLRVWDPMLNKGRDLDLLGRCVSATQDATKVPRWSSRPATRTAGSGTSLSTTTSSASAWWRRSTICSRGATTTRRPTTRKSRGAPASRNAWRAQSASPGILRPKTTPIARSRWPATVGCW
jgi:2-polyprenyl-6-methoxyphenol hydroxylase-like FAD-dependent oxidoreductase